MAEVVTIARPYAEAMFGLAKSKNKFDQMSEELMTMVGIFEDSQMKNFIGQPQTTNQEIESAFLQVMDGITSEWSHNFMRVLIKNNRLSLLPVIRTLYETLKAAEKGSVDVKIKSAYQLEKIDLDKLVGIFSKSINKKITPLVEIDKGLIGGVKVEVGDKVWDMSISGKLKDMSSSLSK